MDRYVQKRNNDPCADYDTTEHTVAFVDGCTSLRLEREHQKNVQSHHRRCTTPKASRASSQNAPCRTTYERFLEVPSSRRSIFIKQRQRRRFAIIVSVIALLFLGMILWVLYRL